MIGYVILSNRPGPPPPTPTHVNCHAMPNEIKNKRAVCLDYKGRMGNHLFMYAFHYAFAKQKNLIKVKTGQIDLFDIFEMESSSIITNDAIYNSSYCNCFPKIQDKYDCGFDETIDALPSGESVYLDGFFQSWRYWIKEEANIRKQFTFKENILEIASRQLHQLLKNKGWNYESDTLIGVHVRRGDYASEFLIKFGQRTAPLGYIRNAMALSRRLYPGAYFLICSDTISWAKEHLGHIDNVVFAEGNTAVVDMAMLTVANHSIITAGTYSWWVGFLNKGITIYYRDIFTRNTTYSAQFPNETITDFFPPLWIGLDAVEEQ